MAETYDVYFGTVSGSLSLVESGTPEVTWTVPYGTLEYDTTYYWRIDATNEYGTTTGDEWSFTTIAFSPPAVSVGGDGNPTGVNNILTIRRIVAVAENRFWYEDI